MNADVFGLLGSVVAKKVRVEEAVGEGGFAVVYRGYHLAFEQPVALKCLKTPVPATSADLELFLARFHDEGRLLFRLSQHAAIVKVFDLGEVQNPQGQRIPYLVLEWLDGPELGTLLDERMARGDGPLSETETVAVLRPAVDAIALAHRLGIVHRDLKPTNLVLANTVQGPILKVLDFGIAKAVTPDAFDHTGATTGPQQAFSPQYAAPEQFRPKQYGATGPWTDVHAIGLILTELATGMPAMRGQSAEDFYDQCLNDRRPTPLTLGYKVSEAFERLCGRCLALNPNERLISASAVLEAMDDYELEAHGVVTSRTAYSVLAGGQIAVGANELELLRRAAHSRREFSATDPTLPQPELIEVDDNDTQPRLARPRTTSLKVVAIGLVAAAGLATLVSYALRRSIQTPIATAAPSAKPIASAEPDMLPIPGGTFVQGADDTMPTQKPAHEVVVASFLLDRREVSVASYKECVEQKGCTAPGRVILASNEEEIGTEDQCNYVAPDRQDHPINCVDWAQARAYCTWANKRLPTEREWEYAARGGDEQRQYPWGNDPPDPKRLNACFGECATFATTLGVKGWRPIMTVDDGQALTSKVNSFPEGKARWGHENLGGNVWEWTETRFCLYRIDPEYGCSNEQRVARGGGWGTRLAPLLRSSFRLAYLPERRHPQLGFRCARSASSPPTATSQ